MKAKHLYTELQKHHNHHIYPFHMPGHKRNLDRYPFYEMDITEIQGFDSLHHATGILKECQEFASEVYGCEETFFLVNGSTCGILSAISACCKNGDSILIARNCHKSVYHSAVLQRLKVHFLYPRMLEEFGICGGICPEDLREALEQHSQIRAVVVTSPTYEGIVSDVAALAAICHEFRVPLIVDEAHGAHFGFAPWLPESALHCGADCVIHSTHKTLPALTQTALLHVNGELVDRRRLKWYLSTYQSSSPSYLLMGSIDDAMHSLHESKERMFCELRKNLDDFEEKMKHCDHVKLLHLQLCDENRKQKAGVFWVDPSRLVLIPEGVTGVELADFLRQKASVELEMAGVGYGIAIGTICDQAEGFGMLAEGVQQIDKHIADVLAVKNGQIHNRDEHLLIFGGTRFGTCEEEKKELYEAFEASSLKRVSLDEAAQNRHYAAEFVYVYPPGIPVLVPGEPVTSEVVDAILHFQETGLSIEGLSDYSGQTILVVEN